MTVLFNKDAAKTRLYLSIDINDVPRLLEIPYVTVAHDGILIVRIEQRKVFHDNSCKREHGIKLCVS